MKPSRQETNQNSTIEELPSVDPYPFNYSSNLGYYSFTSRQGIVYKMQFYQDISSLLNLPFISSITLTKDNHSGPLPFDRRRKATIAKITKHFIDQNDDKVLFYHCLLDKPGSDSRRAMIYKEWFAEFNQNMYELHTDCIRFAPSHMYVGLICEKGNKNMTLAKELLDYLKGLLES